MKNNYKKDILSVLRAQDVTYEMLGYIAGHTNERLRLRPVDN